MNRLQSTLPTWKSLRRCNESHPDSGAHKHPQARDLPCYDPIYNRAKRFRQPFSKSPDRSLARHLAYNGDVAAAQRVVLGRRSILALPSSEEAKRGHFAYLRPRRSVGSNGHDSSPGFELPARTNNHENHPTQNRCNAEEHKEDAPRETRADSTHARCTGNV